MTSSPTSTRGSRRASAARRCGGSPPAATSTDAPAARPHPGPIGAPHHPSRKPPPPTRLPRSPASLRSLSPSPTWWALRRGPLARLASPCRTPAPQACIAALCRALASAHPSLWGGWGLFDPRFIRVLLFCLLCSPSLFCNNGYPVQL